MGAPALPPPSQPYFNMALKVISALDFSPMAKRGFFNEIKSITAVIGWVALLESTQWNSVSLTTTTKDISRFCMTLAFATNIYQRCSIEAHRRMSLTARMNYKVNLLQEGFFGAAAMVFPIVIKALLDRYQGRQAISEREIVAVGLLALCGASIYITWAKHNREAVNSLVQD